MKRFYLLFFFCSSFSFVSGQIDFTPYPGNTTHCPGELKKYTASGTNCGTFTWTITNGKILNPENNSEVTTLTGYFEVDIRWDDVAGTGKLRVSATCGGELKVEEKSFAIRSLKGRVPQNAIALQSLSYCSQNTIALSVDDMLLLNTGGTTGITQKYADGYEWSLPAGWSFNGSSNTRIVNIYPTNNCNGGTVTVKAYVNCGAVKKYSEPSAPISVNRVGFSSNLGIPSGYTGPKCGDQNPVTFTAANLSCATSYRWTATNTTWRDADGNLGSWTTPSNTITLYPSGFPSDDGIIAVEINIGCATLTQTYRAIYTDPPLQKPEFNVFNNQFLLCSNTSAPLSVNPVNSAVSYTWYTISDNPAYNVLLNGVNATQSSPITTTGTQITVQAPTLSNGDRFGFEVRVKANRGPGCQGSLLSQLSGWVGPPLQAHYSQIYVPGFYGENPITLAKGALYQFYIEPVGGASSYTWVLPPGFSFMSNQNTTVETVYIWTGNQSGTFDIRCYPNGICGNSGTGYSSIYVNLPGSGGGSGNPGCEEPPCLVPQPLRVFPNPAKEQLNISLAAEQTDLTTSEESEIILYNKFQQKVYYKKTTAKEIIISTANLPNDIYYLMIKDKNGLTTRQILIEN